MSDYLSNLAARTLNHAEVIQPRLASRFEPVQAQGLLGFAQTAIPTAIETEREFNVERGTEPTLTSPALPSVRRLPVTEPQTAPALQFAGAELSANLGRETVYPTRETVEAKPIMPAPTHSSHSDSQRNVGHNVPVRPIVFTIEDNGSPTIKPSHIIDQPEQPRQAQLLRPQFQPLVDIESQPASETPWALERNIEQEPQDDRRHAQFERRQAAEVLPESVRPVREIEQIVKTISDARPEEIDEREARLNRDASKAAKLEGEDDPLDRVTRPAAVVAQPRIELAPSVRSASPVTAQPSLYEASTAAPTIQVTIGRIEVRATPPTAAPARKANAAPVMSLDDYLRARNGGNR